MGRLGIIAFIVLLSLSPPAQELLELFNRGVELYRLGEWEEAMGVFQEVVKRNPKDGEAWILLGNIYLKKKRYGDAITAYEKGLAQPLPASIAAPAWVNLGVAYQLGKRDWRRALDAYRKAIALKPSLPEAHYNLVNLYLDRRRYKDALKAAENAFLALGRPLPFDRVVATWEKVLSFLRSDYLKAMDLLRSLARRQFPRPEWHALLGQVYEGVGEFQKAAIAYGQAAALAPRVTDYLIAFGWALTRLQRWREAVTVLERAVAMESGNSFALVTLGIAYSELGRWREAEIVLRQAIEVAPQDWVAHVRLATVYERLNQTQKAVQEYLAALGIREDAALLNNLARLYLERGEGEVQKGRWADAQDAFREALTRLRKALQLDPQLRPARFNYGHALLRYGEILAQLGQIKEAEKVFREAEGVFRALLKDHDDPMARLELARVLSGLKRWGEAIQLCRRVLMANPRDIGAYLLLGYFYIALSRLKDAEKVYRSVLKLDPQNADAMTGLGVVAYLQGRYDEARRWFQEALRVSPNHPQALRNLEIIKKVAGRQ